MDVSLDALITRFDTLLIEYDALCAKEDPETEPSESKYKGRDLLVSISIDNSYT